MSEMSKEVLKRIYGKHKIRRYSQLLFGLFLTAIAFNLFILPNNIVIGGVSGVSIIIRNFFSIDPSIFMLVVSIILLIISFIFLGKKQTFASTFGSIMFPILVKLTSNVGNIISFNTNDQLLFALFGGVIYGFGVGLIFKNGFTTGGTDILNQIMQKYAKISIGNSMLIIDGGIVLFGAFVFGFTNFMYGIIALYLVSMITDKVLLGISDSKAFYIITNKKNEICDFVINELGHTITVLDAKGGYTGNKNLVLFTVIPTKEYFKFKAGISEIDNDVFFTVIDAYEVMGGE